MNDNIVVNIDSLDLYIGNRKLLSNFSLRIYDGEAVGMTGPSGVGKTTLVRTILGNTLPSESTAKEFFVKSAIRKAYTPQRGGLFPWYTVDRNLAEISECDDIDEKDQLLTTLGINKILKSFPANISGGEYQRVSLAASLRRESKFLVMDEPLTSVDLQMKFIAIETIFKQWKTKGFSILLISHDVDALLLICDRILCLDVDGKITEIVYKKPNDVQRIDELMYGNYTVRYDEKRHELVDMLLRHSNTI